MQPEATTLERNGSPRPTVGTRTSRLNELASSPAMRWVSLAVRLFLGVFFLVSGAEKLTALKVFGHNIAMYEILPEAISNIAAIFFVWTEILVGVLIVAGAAIRGSALVTASMLVVFLIAILSAMARGMDIDCGCFAGPPQPVGWPKVFEDLGLLVAAIFLIYFPYSYFTIGKLLRREAAEGEPA